jgi:VanZ family protein
MVSVLRGKPDAIELRVRVQGWLGSAWVWLPVAVMLIVIAIESTDTFSAHNTEGWIRPVVERFLGHINDTVWYYIHRTMRKSGHFAGYGLLCLTLLRAWLLTLGLRPGLSQATWRWMATWRAIAGTFCVASLDELHQAFLPSRTGVFSDVILDTVGGTVMCAVVWIMFQIRLRRAVKSERRSSACIER